MSTSKFFRACSTGQPEVVEGLLSGGISPEERDSNHLTGLIVASRKGHVEVARVLLAHGAALEAVDIRQRTALFHGATYKHYELVRFLASPGANVSPVDTHGWTPLDFAFVSRHVNAVRGKLHTTLARLCFKTGNSQFRGITDFDPLCATLDASAGGGVPCTRVDSSSRN